MGPWSDIAKATMSILVPLFTGVWFLIKRWGAMAEKVKRLQAQEVLTSVEALKQELGDAKKYLNIISKDLQESRLQLVAVQTRLDITAKAGEQFVSKVDQMRDYTERRLHSVESALDNGEILKLGPNRFMFKGRRKADGE